MSQKELFWISLTVFLTILAWMLLDIYRIKTRTSFENSLQSLETIDFKINQKVLNTLEGRTP